MARKPHAGVSEQRKASVHRLDDASALFAAGRWRGAMYVAGYAVECLLKSKLMQMYGSRNLSELDAVLRTRQKLRSNRSIYHHELELLLELTGARGRLKQNPDRWRLFQRTNLWTPNWRYSSDLGSADASRLLLNAVHDSLEWIRSNI